jgi:hypothetical protein
MLTQRVRVGASYLVRGQAYAWKVSDRNFGSRSSSTMEGVCTPFLANPPSPRATSSALSTRGSPAGSLPDFSTHATSRSFAAMRAALVLLPQPILLLGSRSGVAEAPRRKAAQDHLESKTRLPGQTFTPLRLWRPLPVEP